MPNKHLFLIIISLFILTIGVVVFDKLHPILFYFSGSLFQFAEWFPGYYLILFGVVRLAYPLILSLIVGLFLSHLTEKRYLIAILFCLHLCFLLLFPLGHYFHWILAYLALLAILVLYDKFKARIKSFFWEQPKFLQKRILFLSVPIFLVLGFYRIVLVYFTENSSEVDASCRIFISQIWADYYVAGEGFCWFLNPCPDWPPLHFYFTGTIYKLTSSILAVRFAHAFVGVLGAFVIYKIGLLVLSRYSACLATIAYLCYPASIYLDLEVMSEPLFRFFLLLSLYGFLKASITGQKRHYLLQVISVNLACMIRYEGWPLAFIYLFMAIVFSRKALKLNIYYFLLSLLGIGFVCLMLYLQGFHPFRGVIYSDYQVTHLFLTAKDNLKTIFFSGYKSAYIPLAFFALIATILFRKTQTHLWMISIFSVLFFLPFLYKNISLTLWPQHRYLTYYMILFLFPLSYWIKHLVTSVFGEYFLSFIVSIIIIASFSSSGHFFVDKLRYHFNEGFNESMDFVNNKITTGNFVLDYGHNVSTYNWEAATRMPLVFGYKDEYLYQFIDFDAVRRASVALHSSKKVIYQVNDKESHYNEFSFERLNHTLKANNNLYLVLFPDGGLDNYFQFSDSVETKDSIIYDLVFSKGGHKIYKKR